jgi:GDP-L-fucose synthase
METSNKIFVAGHRGMVGSAITRRLEYEGYSNLILKTRIELDLTDQRAVGNLFTKEKPDYVFLAAAKVGGIMANSTYPAEFIYQNLAIQTNIIHHAYLNGVKKLLFLGSSCIYPKDSPQPMKEEYLLSGPLETTNEPYAIAKIAGIKMCQSYNKQYGTNFISVMPTNLYGPGDNFDFETSHVLPAIIAKCHDAKLNKRSTVTLWGSGKPKRELLYVDDLADACLFLMNNYDGNDIINIGVGNDLTIKNLANLIKGIVGFDGNIIWDSSKPDGVMRKLLDTSRINVMGWNAKTHLKAGIEKTYEWHKQRSITA